MAVRFGCGCKVKSSSPEDGCFIARSPACVSFSTNTLAGRIYLLQIFFFFFGFGVECIKWKMISFCCAGKRKFLHSDSPSKQQRELVELTVPPAWCQLG